ncbi:MAG TPA: hypothetical protein VMT45_16350 [Thermoanaerobaculaceae bacterium]|nr:hypothetical protein [Thermoanaerobaculaceae bacterium]
MVGLGSLWLPILVSSVLVFLVSSLIHMATPWHKSDYRKMPAEDKVMDALRPLEIPPGDYMVPRPASMKDMKSPEYIDKLRKGPVMVATVLPNGPGSVGKSMVLWFFYLVVIGVFAGYVTGRAVPSGGGYLSVFRFSGVTAFVGYSLALWQMSIWYRRSLGTTFRATVDGLIYALVTAGTFGWLWPH